MLAIVMDWRVVKWLSSRLGSCALNPAIADAPLSRQQCMKEWQTKRPAFGRRQIEINLKGLKIRNNTCRRPDYDLPLVATMVIKRRREAKMSRS